MAIITIKRPSLNQMVMKDYKIFIDRQQVGTIYNGEIKELNITNGQHKISLKVGWRSSPEITIETTENKITILKVGIFKPKNRMLRIILGITPTIFLLYYILKLVFHYEFKYMLFLIIPSILLSIIYSTLGRKKYLTLEEV
jgi:hypothetical protein